MRKTYGRVIASKTDSGHWSFSNAGPRRAGENGATISTTHIGETHMKDNKTALVIQRTNEIAGSIIPPARLASPPWSARPIVTPAVPRSAARDDSFTPKLVDILKIRSM